MFDNIPVAKKKLQWSEAWWDGYLVRAAPATNARLVRAVHVVKVQAPGGSRPGLPDRQLRDRQSLLQSQRGPA
jgi:hypothetical protein